VTAVTYLAAVMVKQGGDERTGDEQRDCMHAAVGP